MSQLSVEDALDICEEIHEMVGEIPERAEEFGDSAEATTLGIQEMIEARNHVTPAQMVALENLKSGLARWLP